MGDLKDKPRPRMQSVELKKLMHKGCKLLVNRICSFEDAIRFQEVVVVADPKGNSCCKEEVI